MKKKKTLEVRERNLRKRALLSAILAKMVKGTFFTILYEPDEINMPIVEVNGKLGVKVPGLTQSKFNLMDEYLFIKDTRSKLIHKIPVDKIIGLKHNGLCLCINVNKMSKYDQTSYTEKTSVKLVNASTLAN